MRPFEQIVTEYGPMVLRVCRAVVGPVDAEDAWSETFLAALAAYPRLDETANTEAWLVTIAHRKAIDSTRASARRPIPVSTAPASTGAAGDLLNLPAAPDVPAAGLGRPEDWDGDLWNALRALPEKQRLVVAYHYLAGLPYQEIATIVGGTADAARRAAADGIRNLRRTYLEGASS
jgi:RNA polymerase sigma factor (sigma-70 family)